MSPDCGSGLPRGRRGPARTRRRRRRDPRPAGAKILGRRRPALHASPPATASAPTSLGSRRGSRTTGSRRWPRSTRPLSPPSAAPRPRRDELAISADLALATESARSRCAYTAIGVPPDGGASWTLPRLVGLRRRRELMLLNERLDAARARELGLRPASSPTTRSTPRPGARPRLAAGADRRLRRDRAAPARPPAAATCTRSSPRRRARSPTLRVARAARASRRSSRSVRHTSSHDAHGRASRVAAAGAPRRATSCARARRSSGRRAAGPRPARRSPARAEADAGDRRRALPRDARRASTCRLRMRLGPVEPQWATEGRRWAPRAPVAALRIDARGGDDPIRVVDAVGYSGCSASRGHRRSASTRDSVRGRRLLLRAGRAAARPPRPCPRAGPSAGRRPRARRPRRAAARRGCRGRRA